MIKKVIKQNILFIIIISCLILLFWTFFYRFVNKPRENEKFEYFFTSSEVVENIFKECVNETMKAKEVTIYKRTMSNSYYQVLLQTEGLISSDILVVLDDLFEVSGATTSFTELTSDFFTSNELDINDYSQVFIDGKSYGIIIKSKEIDLFNGYLEFEDNDKTYVICINKNSSKINEAKTILGKLLKKIKTS